MYLRTIVLLFSAKWFTGEGFYMEQLSHCDDTDHDSDI
jgi:hypothetical protein